MKFARIFKYWWFWVIFFVNIIYNILANISEYGHLYISEILGIIVGSFIISIWIYFLIWLFVTIIQKLFKKKKPL